MHKKKLTRFFLGIAGIALGVVIVSAVCYAIPQTINYQGYLTDSGGDPLNGTVDMVFRLYDVDTGGSPLWTETQTGVQVTDGLFSVNLGEVDPITNPLDLPFDTPYWLGVTVGTDSEMTPRQPVTSVGYSYRAGIADAVTEGGVDSSMLALDAVTADKIDDGAVLTAHLDDDAVTADKLHDDAVTSANIVNDSVSAADIADGSGSGLDADLLDGFTSGDFMMASADNWVDETGDTMSGTLNVPENGLSAGTDQLVLYDSNVGIGTPSPGEKLEVEGNIKVAGTGNGIIFPDDSKQTTAASGTEVLIPISSLPYTITQSGSYYITANLTSTSNGITVNADNVTIDLMGYSLIGPGTCCIGIYMDGRSAVEVRNGTITNFLVFGVGEVSSAGKNHRVIEVRAVGNGSDGIYLNGSGHFIKDCTASDNGSDHGIHAGQGCTVTGNIVYNNSFTGINTGSGTTIMGNTVYGNGSFGIYAGDGCTVTDNTVYNNGASGLRAGEGCTVMGNTAYNNVGHGIQANDGCKVTGNTARNNDSDGIYASYGCTVTGNTAGLNQNHGIELAGNSLVDGNTAYDNNQSGGAYKNISGPGSSTLGLNHNPTIP
jgi:parallel beta-helix repeat protein